MMDESVWIRLVVEHPIGHDDKWHATLLASGRTQLAGVGDFDRIHGGDEDHVEAEETVGDRLARLAREATAGEVYFAIDAQPSRTEVRGTLVAWHEYHEHLFGFAYLAATAASAGGRATLSIMGELDGEILIVLVDAAPERLGFRDEDPQNLDEQDWQDRLGGIESLEQAYQDWLDAR